MIRITGGSLRGRTLAVPDGVRPTAARTREALFSMVGQDLSGWSMLDMFGGSGLIAVEAASRGASPISLVELSGKGARQIRESLQSLGVTGKVFEGNALTLPVPAHDFVFADPPYAMAPELWLPRAASLARRVLVAEGRQGVDWPESLSTLHLDRVRRYGDTTLALYVIDAPDLGEPHA